MNKNTWITSTIVGAALAGLASLVACQKTKPTPVAAPAPAIVPGSPAAVALGPEATLFAMSLNDASGKPQAMSQWKGKPLLVNFWAPWCAPCVKEMPELSTLAGELRAKDVKVIGIGIDTPTNIAQFTSTYQIAYPIYVGGMDATELSRQFGNHNGGLPYTVLIGKDGKVRKTYLGALRFDQLRADLAAL